MLDTLLPLIRKTQSPLSPERFHEAVNVIFHDVEANHYDAVHADMWSSLGRQLNLLSEDVSGMVAEGARLLDVGCGTGLSTQLLLDSSMGPKVSHATLADTSSRMIENAKRRARGWKIPFSVHCGSTSDIKDTFNVILICSVLHHIPNLSRFLTDISALQQPGGIIMHLQDPNGDWLMDNQYRERLSEFESTRPTPLNRKLLGMVPTAAKSWVKRILGMRNYIDEVNERLIQMKVVNKRMTEAEIWSVTDIHVDGLPYSVGKGISLRRMQDDLPDYRLVSARSYGFYGYLESELHGNFLQRERELIGQRALNGRYLAATWIKS